MTRLTCRQARRGLLEFVEGLCGPEAKQGFEEHLRACPPCEQIVESYRKTAKLCGCAFQQEPSPSCCEKVLAALREKTHN